MDKKSYSYQLHVIQQMTGSDATLKIESYLITVLLIYIYIWLIKNKSLLKKMKLWNLNQKGCFSKVSKVLGHTHRWFYLEWMNGVYTALFALFIFIFYCNL